MAFDAGRFDVIVVGGGHAGCEAALAAARLGCATLLVALNLEGIAMMPCNPSIGGTSKGHLVREIDALGGQMGLCADQAVIQSRMLNTGKGPAVHSLRVQTDKGLYHRAMRGVLETTGNLSLRMGECARILTENGLVSGIEMTTGARYRGDNVVVTTGAYLNSRIIVGEWWQHSGPMGYFSATHLSESLVELGFALRRFKTGTPARVEGRSIDFSRLQRQPGDEPMIPFSFMTDHLEMEQVPCWLTYTNGDTHRIIRDNLHRSPMYSGEIRGTGARYCPSIEDKLVRFADKDRHQIFLEPEGRDTTEMYVQGMSSSLPEEVQLAALRTLPGMERVHMLRPGYAIEYDCIDATALGPDLASRQVPGLYVAGQMNGSSGYEEAAAQGLIAGINAAQRSRGQGPFTLTRGEGYIGVLIDDLTVKGTEEPYRMMTSRTEYRLLLRQDNADLRLTEKGYRIGLASQERYRRMQGRRAALEDALQAAQAVIPPGPQIDAVLAAAGQSPLAQAARGEELVRRPGVTLAALAPWIGDLPPDTAALADIEIKYAGYIRRQQQEVERLHRMESTPLPGDLDYHALTALRIEARQKLAARRPQNIGQALRISGVSPADVSVLMVALARRKDHA